MKVKWKLSYLLSIVSVLILSIILFMKINCKKIYFKLLSTEKKLFYKFVWKIFLLIIEFSVQSQ